MLTKIDMGKWLLPVLPVLPEGNIVKNDYTYIMNEFVGHSFELVGHA